MDILGTLMRPKQGNHIIINMSYRFKTLTRAESGAKITLPHFAAVVLENLVMCYGLKIIHTDNGKQFTSRYLQHCVP